MRVQNGYSDSCTAGENYRKSEQKVEQLIETELQREQLTEILSAIYSLSFCEYRNYARRENHLPYVQKNVYKDCW